MALKPVTPKSRGRSPLQRPVGSPFVPAYVKETKSHSGLVVFLLLALAGGAFWYVYSNYEEPVVDNKPKVIVVGKPTAPEKKPGATAMGTAAPAAAPEEPESPRKTALGTVGAPE